MRGPAGPPPGTTDDGRRPATAPGPTVLVPRAGAWGEAAADLVRAAGATPWVLPLIETVPVRSAALDHALERLREGAYAWLGITSAAAAQALPTPWWVTEGAGDAPRVAAVGPGTAAAVRDAGYPVDHVPARDHSAEGLLASWRPVGRVLLLRSDLARPTLVDGLRARGLEVHDVVAYRTLSTDPGDAVARDLANGRADVVLVTSGSVARSVARFDLPAATRVACLGPVTARDAEAAGLRVDVVAPDRSIEALVAAATGTKETP